MRKLVAVVFGLVISWNAWAQRPTMEFYYLVSFTEGKSANFSIDNPQAYLSQKSIDRRKKYNIQLTEADLPVDEKKLTTLTEIEGIRILYTTKWLNGAVIGLVDSTQQKNVKGLATVKGTQYLGRYFTSGLNRSGGDTHLEFAGALDAEVGLSSETDAYGASSDQIDLLNGKKLHALGYNGRGVDVAVFDAGFRKANLHTGFYTLFQEGRLKGTFDLVDQEDTVWEDDSHGMQVWACMAMDAYGELRGTGYGANYYLFRTENSMTEYPIEETNWLRAAEMADSIGIDLINSSLGYTEFDDKNLSYTYQDLNGKVALISKAADFAADRGIMVVTSAGNEGDNKWKYIGTPADAFNVISVAATDRNNNPAYFTSYGPTPDGRVNPNFAALGQRVYTGSTSGKFHYSNGTSFAAPVFAGMLSCLLQAYPNKTHAEILAALRFSSPHLANPDERLGYGQPDFYAAYTALGGNANFSYKECGWLYPIESYELKGSFYNVVYAPKKAKVTVSAFQNKKFLGFIKYKKKLAVDVFEIGAGGGFRMVNMDLNAPKEQGDLYIQYKISGNDLNCTWLKFFRNYP